MYASSIFEEREKCKTGGDAASLKGNSSMVEMPTALLLQKATQTNFCPAGAAPFSTDVCLLGLWAWGCSVQRWEHCTFWRQGEGSGLKLLKVA